MAQAELTIDKSKSDLVACYKERVQLLFDVVVCDFPLHNTGCDVENVTTVPLRLSSSASQEGLEKAIIFLKAVLEESPEFTVERDIFSEENFDMVRKASHAIERQCLAVVDFDPSAREVFVKGQQDHVEAVRHEISRLLMGRHNIISSNNSQKQASITMSAKDSQENQMLQNLTSGTMMCNRDSHVLLEKQDMFSMSGRDQDNNVILDSSHPSSMALRSYSVTTDAEVDYPSIGGSDLIDRGTSNIHSLTRTFAEVVSLKDTGGSSEPGKTILEEDTVDPKPKEPLSDYTSSTSSDEDSNVNVVDKLDPRYENRLEFAVKLGYTERDLDRVILRHGIDCNEDKLLHELIENSAGSGQPEIEVVESISPVAATPDIASSEVFLGVLKKVNKRESENSGSNLRHIVIDGSNVAMSHGKNVFSCRGIKIAVDWFKQRGHEEITVFVPQWRKEASRPDTPITDQEILIELEKEGIVVFTPARRIKGRRVVCYDDRFVLKLAAETNGIVVSNDNYRDLLNENKEYRTVVDERLLMYTFVNDRFMPPEDPLGRRGPTLENFLCKEPTSPPSLPPECPYGRKCTYGNKCKYHHPERGSQPHKTVTEVLKEQATIKMQERAVKGPEPLDKSRRSKPKLTRTRSLAPGEPLSGDKSNLSPLPAGLQEPDSDLNQRKSPTRAGGKSADYLREERKKLEKILAGAAAADPALTMDQSSVAAKVPVSRPQEALSPVPVLGSRGSSPSLLNVPFSSSQEGQLVSGHLLLAKKLSDEASESSFFSNESSSNRASPVTLAGPAVLGVNRQDSTSFTGDKFHDRRSSLQDHHKNLQYFSTPSSFRPFEDTGGLYISGQGQVPSRQSSVFEPSFMGIPGQCQSYPSSEREVPHNILRRMTSYSDHSTVMPATGGAGMETGHREHVPLKPQYSCPPNQFPPSSAPFSGNPFGGMMRQNSSSDPQLHMTGSGDGSVGSLHGSSVPPPSVSMLDTRGGRPIYGSSDQGVHSGQQQPNMYRSTSVQPLRTQQSFGSHTGLDRQISEVMFGSHDQGAVAPSPYLPPWEMGGMFHSHPSTPTHLPSHMPHTPGHQQPGTMSGMGSNMWAPNPMNRMPASPVKGSMPAPRSYPANQPIYPNDSRYSLYYHLCGVFAEPRVRAVMNKYPDEGDPQKLCASIVSEL